jgi:hypothetical protein
MLHTGSVNLWAQAFRRNPLSKERMQRHIAALLLDGLRHKETNKSAHSRKKKR